MTRPDLLLATRSAGKLAELRAMTEGGPWTWRGLEEFRAVADAVEDGETLAENARKKALHYSAATGLPALADDSGLEVIALDGAPGVHSAYFAGHPRDDAANNRKLIEVLRGVPRERRTARFRCCMAFAAGGKVLFESEGQVVGVILDTPRGENGFGYDPHFLIPSIGLTTAELPTEHKNRVSHRGIALRAMLQMLRDYSPAR